MTRVVFDLDFDQGAWPGPLSDREAVAGEVWLGPLGLLGLLETRLGLDGLHATELERALALLRALRAQAGFWSKSLEVDPIGTARHVLHLRDTLRMHGLASRPVDAKAAPRLASLLEAARELPPGLADRLEAAAGRLGSLDPEIEELRLLEEPGGMPAALRGVLDALGKRGVVSPLAPAGAGSPRLLRTQGVLEAAEEVAAWLAQDHDQTVVISPDPVLDAALRRHGLPTLGAAPERADTALLAALPLALELGRAPQDPQRALDLLALPGGPVPTGLCRMLADTLGRWPAVGGARWKKAIESYLGGVKEPRQVEKYRERLDGLFEARVPRGQPYPAAEARRRAEILGKWARGDSEGAAAVRAQCAAFLELLEAYGRTELAARELGRLVEEASLHAPSEGLLPQAGIARVGRPGGVAGPARRVVWWRFVERAAAGPGELPAWLVREARAAGLGELLPDLRAQAVRQAARERRPFEQATEALLLVAPARGEDGQDDFLHPAWGEMCARAQPAVSRVEGPARVRRVAAALPVPAARFQVAPGRLELPAEVSPSKLEKLLGCPLAWALEELGIGDGLFGALEGPGDPALEGNLAHAALEAALLDPLPTPDQAEARALEALEQALAEGGAGFLLPGNEARREELRSTVRYAARDLAAGSRRSGCGSGPWSRSSRPRPWGASSRAGSTWCSGTRRRSWTSSGEGGTSGRRASRGARPRSSRPTP